MQECHSGNRATSLIDKNHRSPYIYQKTWSGNRLPVSWDRKKNSAQGTFKRWFMIFIDQICMPNNRFGGSLPSTQLFLHDLIVNFEQLALRQKKNFGANIKYNGIYDFCRCFSETEEKFRASINYNGIYDFYRSNLNVGPPNRILGSTILGRKDYRGPFSDTLFRENRV